MRIVRQVWRLYTVRRRTRKAWANGSTFESRIFGPTDLAKMGLVMYGILWIGSYALFASKNETLNIDLNKIRVFESATVWQSISIAATLAIAIQVLAATLRYDEKNIIDQRILLIHTEKYLSFVPVFIAALSTLPIIGYFFDYVTSLERLQNVPSLFELALAIAFQWVILALCADAHNRFSGNRTLEKERVYLTRSSSMREIRFMKIFQPPKNENISSKSNIIESLFAEILLTFTFSTIVLLTNYIFQNSEGRLYYLSNYLFEILHMLLPGILILGGIYWLFTTLFISIFIHIGFADVAYKFYELLFLSICAIVAIVASLNSWFTMVLFIPPFAMAVIARMSKFANQKRTWLFPWRVFPGNFARRVMSKYFWRRYETLENRIKECNLKIAVLKSQKDLDM